MSYLERLRNRYNHQMRFIFLVPAILCAIAVTQPVYAHHSQGMYDISTWTMPLAFNLNFSALDKTTSLLGEKVTELMDEGVSRDHLLPGDRVSARCHRLRDGSAGCVLGFVTPMHGDLARGHGVERAWN